MNAAAARRRVFRGGLAPGGCRAALRGAAASPRPRGLRKARLRSPSFSPSFLHTDKVTTVLLSFSYGEWNFGLLFVFLGGGDGAGTGVGVFLGEKYLRGHFRLRASSWRLLMRGWSVEECNCRCGRVARESGRGAARTWKGAAQPEKRRNTSGGQREGTGQPPRTQTNRGSTARPRERTRAPTHRLGSGRSGAQQHERGQRSTLSSER